jgi:hypothetical protein
VPVDFFSGIQKLLGKPETDQAKAG